MHNEKQITILPVIVTTVAATLALMMTTPGAAHGNMESKSLTKDQQAGKVMSPDQMKQSAVLNQLHHLNQMEIEMAKMAQNKAQSQEVKDLASTMIQDHEKLDKRVQEAAKKSNVKLSKYQPAGYEREIMSSFESLSGSEFDRAFLEMNRMSYRETVSTLEASSEMIPNEDLKRLVNNDFLPVIKKHRATAEGIDLGEMQQAGEVMEEPMEESMQEPQSSQ